MSIGPGRINTSEAKYIHMGNGKQGWPHAVGKWTRQEHVNSQAVTQTNITSTRFKCMSGHGMHRVISLVK